MIELGLSDGSRRTYHEQWIRLFVGREIGFWARPKKLTDTQNTATNGGGSVYMAICSAGRSFGRNSASALLGAQQMIDSKELDKTPLKVVSDFGRYNTKLHYDD